MTPNQVNLRRWQLATNYAQIHRNSLEKYTALDVMQASCNHYLKRNEATLLDDLQLNTIWLKFQEAKRTNTIERRKVSGALNHVFHDDTLVLIQYGEEIAEVYAHHRDHGTLFVGTIADGNFNAA
jgi:hypothetical protein